MADGAHDHPRYATREDLNAIDDDIIALAKRVAALERGQEPPPKPDPPQTPPVEPPPEDAPVDPVPEPPDAWDFGTVIESPDRSTLVVFVSYASGTSYYRGQKITTLSGSADVPFRRQNGQSLVPGAYSLLMDGKATVSVEVGEDRSEAAFVLDTTGIADGWHWFRIGGPSGTSSLRHAMLVRESRQDWIPVETGTHGLIYYKHDHVSARVPARFDPRTVPLVPRELDDGTGAYDDAFVTQLVPVRVDDIHRPNINASGTWSSFNSHAYFLGSMTTKYPTLPLLDGDRGRGTVQMLTSAHMGRRGGVYGTDPWRFFHIHPDGRVQTLAGYRHEVHRYWEDRAEPELVGDWSAIPEERRGFHEMWDARVDPDSVVTDPAIQIDGMDGHPNDPRWLVADTQHNEIRQVVFDRKSHDTPARILPFIDGLIDPWNCPIDQKRGLVYITERQGNRIGAWNKDTGQFVRWLYNLGPRPDLLTSAHRVHVGHATAHLSAFPLVWPGDADIFGDWLYVASAPQRRIVRLDLETDEIETVIEDVGNGGILGMRVAQDDSFGEPGEIVTWNWDNNAPYFGGPRLYKPDGSGFRTVLRYRPHAGSGRGSDFGGMTYALSGCVGKGRLVTGGANEGLIMVSRATPDDPPRPDPALVEKGAREWVGKGYHLTHGPGGWSYHSLPLPFGESPAIDAYLTEQGHANQ